MEIMDSVFPFKCENQCCGKEYDLKKFGDVILLWGFILLIAEENETALMGITCPACKKTTIKKYRAFAGLDLLRKMHKHLKENRRSQVDQLTLMREWWIGRCFSAQQLNEKGFNMFLQKNGSAKNAVYLLPEEVTYNEYSKQYQTTEPFSLAEDDVPLVLDFENSQACKYIPRVIASPSSSGFYSFINTGIDAMLLDPSHSNINRWFRNLLQPNPDLRINPYKGLDPTKATALMHERKETIETMGSFAIGGLSWKKKILTEKQEAIILSRNDLLIEEYVDFQISDSSWKRQAFQEHVGNFINDLKAVRNKIDCELIFRNEILNKYGRKFYYKTRSLAESRSDYNELAEIEEAGGIEAYVLGEDAYDFQPCAPPEIINNEDLSAVNVPDAPSENAQTTPKEMAIQCCRAAAQKLVDQNPDITLPAILKTDEFKKSYEGKEDYIPGSETWMERMVTGYL